MTTKLDVISSAIREDFDREMANNITDVYKELDDMIKDLELRSEMSSLISSAADEKIEGFIDELDKIMMETETADKVIKYQKDADRLDDPNLTAYDPTLTPDDKAVKSLLEGKISDQAIEAAFDFLSRYNMLNDFVETIIDMEFGTNIMLFETNINDGVYDWFAFADDEDLEEVDEIEEEAVEEVEEETEESSTDLGEVQEEAEEDEEAEEAEDKEPIEVENESDDVVDTEEESEVEETGSLTALNREPAEAGNGETVEGDEDNDEEAEAEEEVEIEEATDSIWAFPVKVRKVARKRRGKRVAKFVGKSAQDTTIKHAISFLMGQNRFKRLK